MESGKGFFRGSLDPCFFLAFFLVFAKENILKHHSLRVLWRWWLHQHGVFGDVSKGGDM